MVWFLLAYQHGITGWCVSTELVVIYLLTVFLRVVTGSAGERVQFACSLPHLPALLPRAAFWEGFNTPAGHSRARLGPGPGSQGFARQGAITSRWALGCLGLFLAGLTQREQEWVRRWVGGIGTFLL